MKRSFVRKFPAFVLALLLLTSAVTVHADCIGDYNATVAGCAEAYGVGSASYTFCAAGAYVDLRYCQVRALLLG